MVRGAGITEWPLIRGPFLLRPSFPAGRQWHAWSAPPRPVQDREPMFVVARRKWRSLASGTRRDLKCEGGGGGVAGVRRCPRQKAGPPASAPVPEINLLNCPAHRQTDGLDPVCGAPPWACGRTRAARASRGGGGGGIDRTVPWGRVGGGGTWSTVAALLALALRPSPPRNATGGRPQKRGGGPGT